MERARRQEIICWAGLAGLIILLLVVCLSGGTSVVGRIRYLPRQVRSWWRARQPHPLLLPTPVVLPTVFPEPQVPVVAEVRHFEASPTPSPSASPTVLPTVQPTSYPTCPPTPLPTNYPTPTPTPIPTPTQTSLPTPKHTSLPAPAPTSTPTPTPIPPLTPLAPKKVLEGFLHEWQRWNNCGPATLAMALSGFGFADTQKEIARVLKPDPEDKNVSPQEMVAYAQSLGLGARGRFNGDLARLKLLVSNGFAVIAEMWHTPRPNDGMGHYRLVIGYDDQARQFITQDSLNGPGVRLTYQVFDADWRVFNRAYVVLYRPEQAEVIASILGADLEDTAMYELALEVAKAEVGAAPSDAFAWFNVGSCLTALGRYAEAATAFDQARVLGLPWRMLWYQFGPFEAYFRVGRYQDVLDLTAANLRMAGNLEESHYYRGLALRALRHPEEAQRAFKRALKFNPNFTPAAEALHD